MRKFITFLAVSILLMGAGITASARQASPDGGSTTFILEDGSSGQAEVLFTDMNYVSLTEDFVAYAPASAETGLAALPPLSVKELKERYSISSYTPLGSDLYNPASAGIESFLIPGLGQMIAGYPWRGAAFFVTESVLTTAATTALAYQRATPNSNKAITYSIAGICLGLALASHIYCIVDAVQIAKLKNLYLRDLNGHPSRAEMSFAPYVTVTPTLAGNYSPQAGLGMYFNF